MTPVSMPTTSIPKIIPKIVPKIVPSFKFQPSKQYEELPFEDTKSCTEKNMTIPEKESSITVPHNLGPFEIPSNSMSPQYNIPLVTPLPIVPYVSHTYFTLDDVVIPSSSDNLIYYKPERKERISKDTPPPFTTQGTKLSNNLTFDFLGADLFNIVPEEKTEDVLQTTMSWMPVATTIVENQVKMDTKTTTKSVSKNQTLAEDLLNIISEYKSSTTLPEIETIPNLKDELCSSCGKSPQTTTLNTILNDVDDKKFEDPIGYKAAKMFKENNVYSSSSSLKNPTSTSFISLLAAKIKIAQNHKKFLPNTSKKISYSTHPVSTTTTTTQAPQLRKSRRIKSYSRQRKVDSNFTRLSNYNLTNAKSTYSKILRPTLKTNTKQIIPTQNVTEVPPTTSPSPQTKRTIAVRSTPVPKPISSTNLTETTALEAESAIMTISNANARSLRGSMPRFRKRLPDPPKGYVQTTAIPQLPIELYFNKLTKSQ